MKFRYYRLALLAVLFLFICQLTAMAAGNVTMQGVRFGPGSSRDRIVLDMEQLPEYSVRAENDGRRIVLEFPFLQDRASKPAITSDTIDKVSWEQTKNGLRMVIDLKGKAAYKVGQLQNPARVFIDIDKESESFFKDEPASGVLRTKYVRRDGRGMLTAWLLDVDSRQYRLQLALGNGTIAAGRQRLSGISDDNQAVAAINANYFNLNGEIIGVARMEGQTVGTVYYTRTSLGIMPDGSLRIAPIGYNGTVTIGGTALPIAGVDVERGENNLILYNHFYGTSTHTNEYGQEYTVRNGRVVSLQTADSAIPADGMVISVHGTAKDAFAGVKVGDAVRVQEDYGAALQGAQTIIGGGPTLVRDGQVLVTAREEEFPSDIAHGRAPRTALGILPNHHVLLAVVDGRQSHSIGCTLTELGALMKKFGAVDAINFDGGGSSEMVVGGQIQNSPSDGAERPVASAIIVVKK